ncbi:MAG: hypothetical protein AAFX93_09655 [Verrucomicrobiota bacterium]
MSKKKVITKKSAKRLDLVPPTSPRVSIGDLCERYSIIQPDLTRLTGYSPRTVATWKKDGVTSNAAMKQVRELIRLFAALSEHMEPNYVGTWLKDPNDAFEGSTPLQVIERGHVDRIWRMIYYLETGQPF